MADHSEGVGSAVESVIEKISEKIHARDSSSSDSDDDKSVSQSSVKAKIYRAFGREKPVHHVLGGGKPADIFLWRNKKISASVLGGATAIWVFFELLEYHLLTLVCHILILALAMLFLWSNAHTFINKTPPRIPEVHLPEEPFLQVAAALRIEINRGFVLLRDIVTGRDLKEFLIISFLLLNLHKNIIHITYCCILHMILTGNSVWKSRLFCYLIPYKIMFWMSVIAGFWVLSIVGSWCNFLTLFYISFVLLQTVPVLYEKYEDKVDPFAEKVMVEIKKQYAVFDAKVLSKISKGTLKGKFA